MRVYGARAAKVVDKDCNKLELRLKWMEAAPVLSIIVYRVFYG